MFARAFGHLGEEIDYTVNATGARSCFLAIIRRGVEFLDENNVVVGRDDFVDILKTDIETPKRNDSFVHDGTTFSIGVRDGDNGAYTTHRITVKDD